MSETDSTDPRVGTVLDGRYRIQRRLSAGAMGVVYQGERVALGRAVAVKFLHPYFAQIKDFTRRFEREALTMSRLNHPNCVSVIDFGMSDGPYIVMDFVDGRPLNDLIDDGPLPVPRAIAILRQVLAGLAHAHQQGIIHRDVKPANVMLSAAAGAGDHVQLLDFGLAKLRDADVSATGMVVGTPSYMSPEQARYKPLDGRTDVYSAGVMLFELLTGNKPFQSDEAVALLRMHIEDPPPALADRAPEAGFPAALERVVARALAKEPDERYGSPIEFSRALDAVLDGGDPEEQAPPRRPPAGAPAERPAAAVAARVRRGSRGRWRWPVVLFVVVAAAGWVFAGLPGVPAAWKEKAEGAFGGSEETPPPTRPEAHTIADVEALIAAGEREPAIRALHRLRRARPGDAEVQYLLGTLYFDKGWPVEGLAAYGEAVRTDASYRTRAELIRDAIDALDDPRAGDEAHVFLVEAIGEAAIDDLRRAVNDERPGVASAARKTIADIEARRRR